MSGCGDIACRDGTFFVTYTLLDGAEQADNLMIKYGLAGATTPPLERTVTRGGTGATGAFEIAFKDTPFPREKAVDLTLIARRGTEELARKLETATPAGSCATFVFELREDQSGDLGAGDQSPPTGDSSLATDLADDLTAAPDLSTARSINVTVTGLVGSGLVLRNNAANDLTVDVNGTFAFSEPVMVGGDYSVVIVNQPKLPTQECSVMNGAGAIVDTDVTIQVACRAQVLRFGYIANSDKTISVYSWEPTTKLLRTREQAVYGTKPRWPAVDPTNRFLFVTDSQANNVTAFAIDPKSGAITPINTAATGTEPGAAVVAPSGKFLYVANDSAGVGTVSGYAIDQTTGALTSVGAAVSVGGGATNPVVDATGKFLFVADRTGSSIAVFSIDQITGVLTTSVGPFFTGTQPRSIATDPTGRFVYTANWASSDVSIFRIDATTGALTSAGTVSSSQPEFVTVHPTGRFLFTANPSINKASVYTIDPMTGGLTSVGVVSTGGDPRYMTISPDGAYAYVSCTSGELWVYPIDAVTGAWYTPRKMPIRSGESPLAATTGFEPVKWTPTFAYVVNESSKDVSSYAIDSSTGQLAKFGSPIAIGTDSVFATLDSLGKWLYVGGINLNGFSVSASTGALTAGATIADIAKRITLEPTQRFAHATTGGKVTGYSRNTGTGALTAIGAGAGTGSPNATINGVVADHLGRYVYAAGSYFSSGFHGEVATFAINQTTGEPTLSSTSIKLTMVGDNGDYLAIDPYGRWIYVVSFQIRGFSIKNSTLTEIDMPAVASGQTQVEIDPTGRFLYTFYSSDAIRVRAFAIDQTTGALNLIGDFDSGGTSPLALSAEPSGKFLYVAHPDSKVVTRLAIDGASGALTLLPDSEPVLAGQFPTYIVTAGTSE